jgi:hypothetical protein
LLIEEKRHGAWPDECQLRTHCLLHKSIIDTSYLGFYLVRFENTNPDDGHTEIHRMIESEKNGKPILKAACSTKIDRARFIMFLMFDRKWRDSPPHGGISPLAQEKENIIADRYQ